MFLYVVALALVAWFGWRLWRLSSHEQGPVEEHGSFMWQVGAAVGANWLFNLVAFQPQYGWKYAPESANYANGIAYQRIPPHGGPLRPGAVLYIHGNAGSLATQEEHCRKWAARIGVPFYPFDPPGYGCSRGKVGDSWVEAACDVIAVIPERPLVAWGLSMGGHAAAALSDGRVDGVLLESTFATALGVLDLRMATVAHFFGVRRMESAAALRGATVPVAVVHGMRDGVIHYMHGKRLADATPAHLLVVQEAIPNADHGDVSYLAPVTVQAALVRLLNRNGEDLHYVGMMPSL